MALVLALEPDLRQATILKRVIRREVRADLVLVDSRDAAIAALSARVPDVVLLTALLSPRDEEELITHLRSLEGAEHLQTHTIPQLASSSNDDVRTSVAVGLFGKLLGKKEPEATIPGCDPELFAAEVRTFLDRAEEMKTHPAVPLIARESEPLREPHVVPPEPDAAREEPRRSAQDGEQGAPSKSWDNPFEWRRADNSQEARSPAYTGNHGPIEGQPAPVEEPPAEQEISDTGVPAEPVLAAADREPESAPEPVPVAAEDMAWPGTLEDANPVEEPPAVLVEEEPPAVIEVSETTLPPEPVLALSGSEGKPAPEPGLGVADSVGEWATEPLRPVADSVEESATESVRPVADGAAGSAPEPVPAASKEDEGAGTSMGQATVEQPLAVQEVSDTILPPEGEPFTLSGEWEPFTLSDEAPFEQLTEAEEVTVTDLPLEDLFAAFREEADEQREGVLRYLPLSLWARRELPKRTATPAASSSDLHDLLASVSRAPHVTGVAFPRGCRIRRVRVPAAPRGRAAHPVILSRRALEEVRAAEERQTTTE